MLRDCSYLLCFLVTGSSLRPRLLANQRLSYFLKNIHERSMNTVRYPQNMIEFGSCSLVGMVKYNSGLLYRYQHNVILKGLL